jgi:hypothetical protein
MKWPEDTLLARKSLLNWARGYKHQIPKRSQDLFQALVDVLVELIEKEEREAERFKARLVAEGEAMQRRLDSYDHPG